MYFLRRVAVSAVAFTMLSVGGGLASPASAASMPVFPAMDYEALQWHLAAVNVREAWSVSTGAGVTVAVIDSGLDMSSVEFAGRIVSPARVTEDFEVVADPNLKDAAGHGTHVAGIIAASAGDGFVTGVAPDAKIMPINIYEAVSTPEKSLDAVALATDYAVKNGARVINMSLGAMFIDVSHAPASTRICRAVKDAVQAGVVVVVSAGNDGAALNGVSIPAACPGALSVAAVDMNLQPAYWSSSDATVNVAAPGESIVSALPSSGPGSVDSGLPVGAESGTSMAAPVVSGVAALVVSLHPDWSVAQVRESIERSTLDVFVPGKDSVSGYGVVDAAKAVGLTGVGSPSRQNVLVVNVDSGSNFSELGYPDCKMCAYVWWKTLPVPVQYYQVTIWNEDGTVTESRFGPEIVRAMMTDLRDGDWVMVSAVLVDGSVVRSVPTRVGSNDGASDSQKPMATVKMRWASDTVVKVSWNVAPGSDFSVTEVSLIPLGSASVKDVIVRKVSSPAQGSVLVRVPSRFTGLGLSTYVKGVGSSGEVTEIYAGTVVPNFPAYVQVVPAGEDNAGITGRMYNATGTFIERGVPVVVTMANGDVYSTVVLDNGMFSVVVPSSGEKRRYRFSVRLGEGKGSLTRDFALPLAIVDSHTG